MNTLSRRERLRRVVLLCSSFARNLAFYRVGQSNEGSRLLPETNPNSSFWLQANGNFLDAAVLEWSKLLGEKKAGHYWGEIVTDPATFETEMLARIGKSADTYEEWIREMRHYRDKFVAHLDSERTMQIPLLDTAKTSVWFYHEYVVTHEAQAGDLTGLSDTARSFNLGYEQCIELAKKIFQHAE